MKKIGTAIAIGAAALAAATSISAATPAKTTAMGQKNIVQTAVAAGKFKTLGALVKKAGLAGKLSAPGNLTVFAPTDRAFANLKKSEPALYNKVATNKKLLQSVLSYHVVGKRIPAAAATAAAKKRLKVKTVQGESIALSFKGGKGVATGAGAFLPIIPVAAMAGLLTFAVVAGITRYASIGSIAGASALPIVALLTHAPAASSWAAAAAAALIIWKHRGNLSRIAAGTERRLGSRAAGPS